VSPTRGSPTHAPGVLRSVTIPVVRTPTPAEPSRHAWLSRAIVNRLVGAEFGAEMSPWSAYATRPTSPSAEKPSDTEWGTGVVVADID
jgi:hypothetical protein